MREGFCQRPLSAQCTSSVLADVEIKLPHRFVRVTDSIPHIVAMIQRLIDRGVAYATADGDVDFSIASYRQQGFQYPRFRSLCSSTDFCLWKRRKSPKEPAWPSPWGLGRPGWHMECSSFGSRCACVHL